MLEAQNVGRLAALTIRLPLNGGSISKVAIACDLPPASGTFDLLPAVQVAVFVNREGFDVAFFARHEHLISSDLRPCPSNCHVATRGSSYEHRFGGRR